MAKVQRAVLKEYFQTGDRPTQPQFSTMLDSMVNFVDDRDFIGLRSYNPTQDYLPGDCAVFNDQVVKCITATTGVFNPTHWTILAAFGSVNYIGTWDTQNNVPPLASSIGSKGSYYVVFNASSNPDDNTELNGIDDWGTGDWAIFNGTVWEKVDNSEAPVVASNVSFSPFGPIAAADVQTAVEEVYNELDASKLNLSGGSMTGPLILSGNPTDVFEATTKAYVDAIAATKLDITGGTLNGDLDITGDLTLSADPTTALGAATKQYVDAGDTAINAIVSGKVNRSGDAMMGLLALSGDPVSALDAVTKQYADALDAAQTVAVNTKVSKAGDNMTGLLTLSGDPTSALNAVTKQYADALDAAQTVAVNTKVSKAGDVMSGLLTLSGDPTSALNAVTKQYADALDAAQTAAVNTKVSKAGDIMTGLLTLSADPSSAMNASTKNYTDVQDALKVDKAGDIMTGLLTLSGDPTAALHAATKQYVDARTQKFVVPITFGSEYAVSGTDFVRIPLQIVVPPAASVFASATQIQALLCVDYLTDSGTPSLEGEAAITVWDGSSSGIPTAVSGSTVLLTTVSQWTRVTGVTPFTLPASRSYQVIFRKTAGQIGRRIRIEAASLILFYS